MVTKYGFSPELGTVTYGKDNSEVFLGRDLGHERNYSEEVANQIDRAIRKLIDNAYAPGYRDPHPAPVSAGAGGQVFDDPRKGRQRTV